MKKLLFTLSALAALTLLAPAPGFAYDNIMALIFSDPAEYTDGDALVPCTTGTGMGVVPCYVVLINPTIAAVYGYEFGFTIAGGTHMLLSVEHEGTSPIDVGGGNGNHIVGLASGMAVNAGGATLLSTINIFNQDTVPVEISFTGADPNSNTLPEHKDLPALLGANDLILPAGSSTLIGDVTAAINCIEDIVGVDEASWDSIKSLYR